MRQNGSISPSGASLFEKFSVTSAASAFMGATYTILKSAFWITPYRKLSPTSRRTVIMAMFVLPAPGCKRGVMNERKQELGEEPGTALGNDNTCC